jgi:U4/U6.U5 tri-snRNP component SNU23
MSFRRTWDKEYFAQKALERAEGAADDDDGTKVGRKPSLTSTSSSKEEFQKADADAAGPMGSERAFLKAREGKIDLESKVGKVEVINQVEDATRAGFWCEVCSCLLKDSASYLSHINGKKRKFLLSCLPLGSLSLSRS